MLPPPRSRIHNGSQQTGNHADKGLFSIGSCYTYRAKYPHAAREGRAVVLAGPPGAGKSTLETDLQRIAEGRPLVDTSQIAAMRVIETSRPLTSRGNTPQPRGIDR